MTYLYSYSKWWYICIMIKSVSFFSFSRCSVYHFFFLRQSVYPIIYFTMFSVSTHLFHDVQCLHYFFLRTISVSNRLFRNVQYLHSSISRCSVFPLFFYDNLCLHSYVQCLHSSFSRCLYAKHLSPYLYFTNCSVSTPLFHDVQCLHSSISRCSVFPLFFYDNLCFTISLSLIHIWRCRRYAVCRSRWSPYH